jgi:vacuolar iron transporter family protein
MMVWELNLLPVNSNPALNGVVTFLSFALFGSVPIFPFVLNLIHNLGTLAFLNIFSLIFTLSAMFLLGAFTGKFTRHNIYLNGLKTVLMGSFAGFASFVCAYLAS